MTFTTIMLFLAAIYPIYLGIFTPAILWNTTRTRRFRKLFGDNIARILYVVIGLAIIFLGINQPRG